MLNNKYSYKYTVTHDHCAEIKLYDNCSWYLILFTMLSISNLFFNLFILSRYMLKHSYTLTYLRQNKKRGNHLIKY